jgi:hypothetical protein
MAGPDRAGAYAPTEAEARDLIARAEAHELGLGFLKEGAQDAVAALFRVHAFLVDAARDLLRHVPGC